MSEDEAARLSLTIEPHGDGAVIAVGGELDFGTVESLHAALRDLARRGSSPVVLDLAAVDFMDSSGISVLVQAKQRADAAAQKLVLRRPTTRVLRVLEVTGLVELFVIE